MPCGGCPASDHWSLIIPLGAGKLSNGANDRHLAFAFRGFGLGDGVAAKSNYAAGSCGYDSAVDALPDSKADDYGEAEYSDYGF